MGVIERAYESSQFVFDELWAIPQARTYPHDILLEFHAEKVGPLPCCAE
jgi:hypothetical protein